MNIRATTPSLEIFLESLILRLVGGWIEGCNVSLADLIQYRIGQNGLASVCSTCVVLSLCLCAVPLCFHHSICSRPSPDGVSTCATQLGALIIPVFRRLLRSQLPVLRFLVSLHSSLDLIPIPVYTDVRISFTASSYYLYSN